MHSVYVNGFPNLFIAGGLRHAGVSANGSLMLETQAQHIAELLNRLIAGPAATFEIEVAGLRMGR